MKTMATVLQRVKNKRLTIAQEEESRVIFELGAQGLETMTVKQVKICLRAMGFSIAKSEAQALVYELDFANSNTIDLADFQKIFLSKMLEKSEREHFDEAFRVMSNNLDQVSIRQLSAALEVTNLRDYQFKTTDNEAINADLFRRHMSLQYYDDKDQEAVHDFLDSSSLAGEETCISKRALAAFLRI